MWSVSSTTVYLVVTEELPRSNEDVMRLDIKSEILLLGIL